MKFIVEIGNVRTVVAEKIVGANGLEHIELHPLIHSLLGDTKVKFEYRKGDVEDLKESVVRGIKCVDDLKDFAIEFNENQEIENMSTPEYVEKNYIDKIEFSKRKSIFASMNSYISKKGDFIEITEWTNGEGWDITISDEKTISLHETEFEVIKLLIDKLQKDNEQTR